MNKPKVALKDRLSEALALRGKKAVDLTRELGVPKSAISQYLSGKSQTMDADRLQKIATYLGVNEPWLAGYDVPMELVEDGVVQNADSIDTFVNRFQMAFRRSGLTQAQLAIDTGITKASISRYLQGEFKPKTEAVIKLASALNVSVEYLMGLDGAERLEEPVLEDVVKQKSESRKVLSANLRGLMGRAGKSQKEVSEAIGVSCPTFSDWYNGKKYPRIEKIEALAKYFDVSVSELVGEATNSKSSESNQNDKADVLEIILRLHTDKSFFEAVEKISGLDSEKLESLQQFLKAFEK